MFVSPRRKHGNSLNAVTATGAGSTVDFGPKAAVRDVRYYIKAATVTTGASIQFEVSFDNSTWYKFGNAVSVSATGNTSALLTSAGAGAARYWRAKVASYTDGTYTVDIQAESDY